MIKQVPLRAKNYLLCDLHLQQGAKFSAEFCRFVQHLNPIEDQLILLGDLFHFSTALYASLDTFQKDIYATLANYRKKGGYVTLFLGNREFLFFPKKPSEPGVDLAGQFDQVIGDFGRLLTPKTTFLLHHGDTLNQKDWKYLTLRKVLRAKAFLLFFHTIPKHWAVKLIFWLQSKFTEMFPFVPKAFPTESWHHWGQHNLKKFQADCLFIGHYHPNQPIKNQWNNKKIGYVLSPWYVNGSYVIIDNKGNYTWKHWIP